MKTLFILGAGASKSAGAPLMSDFLDRARELHRNGVIADPIGKPAFEDVFEAIGELQGIYAKSHLDLDNIENLFGAIEIGRVIGKFANRDPASIDKLRESLIKLIVKTLENTIAFPVAGNHINPTPAYRHFIDLLYDLTTKAGPRERHDFSFVTFNYDIAPTIGFCPNLCVLRPEAVAGVLPVEGIEVSITRHQPPECSERLFVQVILERLELLGASPVRLRHVAGPRRNRLGDTSGAARGTPRREIELGLESVPYLHVFSVCE